MIIDFRHEHDSMLRWDESGSKFIGDGDGVWALMHAHITACKCSAKLGGFSIWGTNLADTGRLRRPAGVHEETLEHTLVSSYLFGADTRPAFCPIPD